MIIFFNIDFEAQTNIYDMSRNMSVEFILYFTRFLLSQSTFSKHKMLKHIIFIVCLKNYVNLVSINPLTFLF